MPVPDSSAPALPTDGQADFERLAEALRTASGTLGLPDTASLRSLRYQDGESWHNIATALVLGEDEPVAQDRTVAGIRLLARRIRPSEIAGADDLRGVLSRWPGLAESDARRFEEPISVRRSFSDPGVGALPGWLLGLKALRDQPRTGGLPSGPFFDPAISFFAEGLSSVARRWMPQARWDGSSSPSDDYRVIIPDRRGFFSSVERGRKSVTAQIAAITAGQLYCCAQLNGYGADALEIRQVVDGQATFISDRPVQSFSLYLVDSESYTYDSAHYPRMNLWGGGTVAAVEDHDPSLERLLEDVAAGEGQTIEYKAWIPPSGDKSKWRELLDTVVGFANASGGRLYIGVNDRGEIVGVDGPLKREYGEKHRDNTMAQREDYMWALQQFIAKGIQPSLTPVLEWFEPAGKQVLCIAVEREQDAAYYVVETNEIFVRRGATIRRALPHELEQMFASQQGQRRRFTS